MAMKSKYFFGGVSFTPCLALAACSVFLMGCPKKSEQMFQVGSHCSIYIPDGYERNKSSNDGVAFSRSNGETGRIVVKKGDFSGTLGVDSKSQNDAEKTYRDEPFVSFRRYIISGKQVDFFRVTFADYSIGISGADAGKYQSILGQCLPEKYKSIEIQKMNEGDTVSRTVEPVGYVSRAGRLRIS